MQFNLADLFEQAVDNFGERPCLVVDDAPNGVRISCRKHVAGYEVPRELVLVERIERSPAGKPDYRWARAAARGEAG